MGHFGLFKILVSMTIEPIDFVLLTTSMFPYIWKSCQILIPYIEVFPNLSGYFFCWYLYWELVLGYCYSPKMVVIWPILSQIYFIILYTDLVNNTPKQTRFGIQYPKGTFVLILQVKKEGVLNFQNFQGLFWFYYLYIKYNYLYSRFHKMAYKKAQNTKVFVKTDCLMLIKWDGRSN